MERLQGSSRLQRMRPAAAQAELAVSRVKLRVSRKAQASPRRTMRRCCTRCIDGQTDWEGRRELDGSPDAWEEFIVALANSGPTVHDTVVQRSMVDDDNEPWTLSGRTWGWTVITAIDAELIRRWTHCLVRWLGRCSRDGLMFRDGWSLLRRRGNGVFDWPRCALDPPKLASVAG